MTSVQSDENEADEDNESGYKKHFMSKKIGQVFCI